MIEKEPIKHCSKLEMFFIILKTSTFTLGGGILIISELKKNLVGKKKIISEDDFHEIISKSSVIPGATVINFSFLLGEKLGGFFYSILLTFAGLLPSLLVITLIAFYVNFDSNNIYFLKFLEGSKISSSVIMLIVTIEFSRKMMRNSIIKWIICILVIYALNTLKVDFAYILIIFFVIYSLKYTFFEKKKNKERI